MVVMTLTPDSSDNSDKSVRSDKSDKPGNDAASGRHPHAAAKQKTAVTP